MGDITFNNCFCCVHCLRILPMKYRCLLRPVCRECYDSLSELWVSMVLKD